MVKIHFIYATGSGLGLVYVGYRKIKLIFLKSENPINYGKNTLYIHRKWARPIEFINIEYRTALFIY